MGGVTGLDLAAVVKAMELMGCASGAVLELLLAAEGAIVAAAARRSEDV